MAYDKLSTYQTTVVDNDDHLIVTYHMTPIVTVDKRNGFITLRSGGWETVTTKRKLNQASHQFGLGYSVSQRNFVWYLTLPSGVEVEFEDGVVFDHPDKKPRRIEFATFELPTFWASALINGDTSGMEDEDEAQLEAFQDWMIKEYGQCWCVGCADEGEHFAKYHDAERFGVLACDVIEYQFDVTQRQAA